MNTRLIRYLVVGTYNAVAGYLFFYLANFALGDTLHYLAVLVVSYFLSITHAYVGQRWLVFRSNSDWKREYLRFFLINMFAMVGNALLLVIFVGFGTRLLLAQAVSVIIVTVLSFFGHRHFSFRSA